MCHRNPKGAAANGSTTGSPGRGAILQHTLHHAGSITDRGGWVRRVDVSNTELSGQKNQAVVGSNLNQSENTGLFRGFCARRAGGAGGDSSKRGVPPVCPVGGSNAGRLGDDGQTRRRTKRNAVTFAFLKQPCLRLH